MSYLAKLYVVIPKHTGKIGLFWDLGLCSFRLSHSYRPVIIYSVDNVMQTNSEPKWMDIAGSLTSGKRYGLWWLSYAVDNKLEIILTLLHQIGIPPPTVAPG